MVCIFNGQEVDFQLKRANFFKRYGTNTLVYFQGTENADIVTVDDTADGTYTMYAGIHECICQGKRGDLAPEVDDPNKRCGKIDCLIVNSMPKSQREQYVKKRIEMFDTLLKRGLNPRMDPSFRESLEMLKEMECDMK